jgi:hypothetical protein
MAFVFITRDLETFKGHNTPSLWRPLPLGEMGGNSPLGEMGGGNSLPPQRVAQGSSVLNCSSAADGFAR